MVARGKVFFVPNSAYDLLITYNALFIVHPIIGGICEKIYIPAQIQILCTCYYVQGN